MDNATESSNGSLLALIALLLFCGLLALLARQLWGVDEPAFIALGLVAGAGLAQVLRSRAGSPVIDYGEQAMIFWRWCLEREIARSRRHGRSFAVLSIAGATTPDDLERRAQRLTKILHSYTDVVINDGRILALVPEADDAALSRVVHRVRRTFAEESNLSVGTARFPADEVSAETLIAMADRQAPKTPTEPSSALDLAS